MLGTPTDDMWPGVTELKDYKQTFPKWKKGNLADSVKNVNDHGLDLLAVGYDLLP